jgi:signal transduction histidine kinase
VAGWRAAPVRLRWHVTWRRWSYLVLGGALLVPFGVLGSLVAGVVPGTGTFAEGVTLIVTTVVTVPLLGLVPGVRALEDAATRELVGGPLRGLPGPGPAAWPARLRGAAWFSGHVLVGGLMSVVSLAPAGVALLVADDGGSGTPGAGRVLLAGVAALGALLALYPLTAAVGAGFAVTAPTFLGPSAADRLAALERRAAQLAERNRVARDLHDSVGHTLSMVTIQAGAAGRVLDRDPDFARAALAAIEESAREALADLDRALGTLRDGADRADRAAPAAPSLAALDDLLHRMRLAGLDLDAELGEVRDVPAEVSQEAYRIVQEALTNAVRHAAGATVRLRVEVRDGELIVEVGNPLAAGTPAGSGTSRPAVGGRGLDGVRERVATLRGTLSAGPVGDAWVVAARLPLDPPGGRRE